MGRTELSKRMRAIIQIDDNEFIKEKQAEIASIRELEKVYDALPLRRACQRKKRIKAGHDLKQSRAGRRQRAWRWGRVS